MRTADLVLAFALLSLVVLLMSLTLLTRLIHRKPRPPRRNWFVRLRWWLARRRANARNRTPVTAGSLAAPRTSMPTIHPPVFHPAPPPSAPVSRSSPMPSPAPQALLSRPRPDPAAEPGRPLAAGPRLPETTVVDCRSHASLFYGWCAPPSSPPLLQVRGATWRGGMHSADGTEGQDAVGAAWNPVTGSVFVAVADGLGSLPRSGQLAREAVPIALHLCLNQPKKRPFGAVGPQLFQSVLAAVHKKLGPDVAANAGTTLVIAELRPTVHGAHLTVHGVGDSEAWVLRDGHWSPVHDERGPVGDGPVNPGTRDLPTDDQPHTNSLPLNHGDVVLLATDGFADRINRSGSWSARTADRLARVPAPMEFLDVVALGDEPDSDDRGVVAVWVA
jgi:serine/threonine protein phosphatase PrpC